MLVVNGDLALPKLEANVACKPSLFAYPAALVAEKKEEVRAMCFLGRVGCVDRVRARSSWT